MSTSNKFPALASSIGLLVLVFAVAAEPLFSSGRVFYIVGLVAVILLSASIYYGDIFFDGIVDARKAWPKLVFAVLAILVTFVVWISTSSQPHPPSGHIKLLLPRLAVSLLLLWYGATVFFSSFFMGKDVAVFMHNPMAWLSRSRSQKRRGSGR